MTDPIIAAARLDRYDLGHRRPCGVRILGPSQDHIELGQDLDRPPDRLCCIGDESGEREQDALDLALLGQLQLAIAIVQLNRRQRLDERGGATGRLVVHQAGDAPLGVGAHRDHKAPIALRDVRFLQIVGIVRVA